MTDFRALCAELLADCEEHLYRPVLADRARAALAQPEPEVVADGPAVPEGRELAAVVSEPSDEELLELAQQHSVSYTMSDGTVLYPLQEGCDMRDDVLSFARAVLARWGRPAPAPSRRHLFPTPHQIAECGGPCAEGGPAACDCGLYVWRPASAPAEGEVAELVAWLRRHASAQEAAGTHWADQFTRAADLLEQHQAASVPEPALARINDILNDSGRVLLTDVRESLQLAREALQQRQTAPVPVAVAERLPDASDPRECRMPDGSCWWFDPHEDGAWYFDTYQGNYTHWLPATALPLPQGEVQP